MLARHHTLVAELLDGPDLLLMTAAYSDRPVPLPGDRDALRERHSGWRPAGGGDL